MILAVPTFITDISGASNIFNRYETFYVRSADLKACEWIRTHLPRTAIVQSQPDYIGNFQVSPSLRGDKELSLIPTFALRRSALGEEFIARSICAGCDELTDSRESDLDMLFKARDPAVITSVAAKYKIDYLYIGPFEQSNYPAFLSVLDRSPRFEEVYNEDSVHIFRIVDEKPLAVALKAAAR
jgi:hypothetical protein